MRIKTMAALALPALATGCATATRGTTEQVVINYAPATATVTTSLNHTCRSSPCTIEVSREKRFVVTAAAPGYEMQTVAVNTKLAGRGTAAFAGNVLVGGVIGMGVDAATGATLDLAAGTATLVWSYDDGTFSRFAGSSQRLPNGNTFIGWGGGQTTTAGRLASEVTPAGAVVFELWGEWPSGATLFSYRSVR